MSENKEKISISIDAALLRRIDVVCANRDEARSAFFERLAENQIGEEETFTRLMENPLWRGFLSALTSSPAVLKAIATVAGDTMSDEELHHIRERLPELAEL